MTEEIGVAHHGPPVLTQRDLEICKAMAEWIRLVHKERKDTTWLPSDVDIIKSRLFWRLRSGKKPLASPPPTAFSCPWYELIDEPERAHWAYDLWEHPNEPGKVFVAQCPYDKIADGIAQYGPYKFKYWKGSQDCPSYTKEKGAHMKPIEGWYIQLINE